MFTMTFYFSVRVMDLGIAAEMLSNEMVKECIRLYNLYQICNCKPVFFDWLHEAIRPVVHSCMSFVGSCFKCNG